ncbi:hypothetical protein VIBNIAM115_890020 [Vibrio nigripulchritudo AM115]|nr:hypothetical protein VIBNIAM115_890020 [Vibrio nigripulchritudo AM115]
MHTDVFALFINKVNNCLNNILSGLEFNRDSKSHQITSILD